MPALSKIYMLQQIFCAFVLRPPALLYSCKVAVATLHVGMIWKQNGGYIRWTWFLWDCLRQIKIKYNKKHIRADASVGIASNKCWSLPTHACISSTAAELQNYYILGHHNVKKFAAAGKQSNNSNSNSAARDLLCTQGRAVCSKAGNANTTLTYLGEYQVRMQSMAVPSIACCPESSLFSNKQATMS